MKKIITIKLVAALLMALAPLLLAASGQISYTATYGGDVTLGTRTLGGATYTTVAYQGLYNVGDPGKPSLPVDFIRFSVPCNATNFTVTATPVVGETLQLDYPVCPIQANPSTVTPPDNMAYSLAVYPSASARYEDQGMLAGENHIITVAVNPMTIMPGNRLKVCSAVNLTISYDLSDTPPIKPLVRTDTVLLNRGHDIARSVVVNPGDVSGNAASQSAYPLAFNYILPLPDDSVSNPATFLIITTQEMLRPLRRLTALKSQKGINVKVVTLDDALSDPIVDQYTDPEEEIYPAGAEDASRLRQYLRMYYLHRGTQYVLLAGSEIPYRSNSDLSFSSLNSDYNSYVDRFPELVVGRLLGSRPDQFTNYTDKLLRYELNPGNGDYSYLRRSLSTEGPGYETLIGSMIDIIFQDTLITHDEAIEFTGSDFLNLINTNHYGLVNTYNDGSPAFIELYRDGTDEVAHYLWGIDTVRVPDTIIDHEIGNGLNCMLNKDYPMICYSPIGQTMPYYQVDGYDIDMNFGESFTMGKDYGGPVYIGSTEENTTGTKPYSASTLASLFASHLSEAEYNMSLALSKAKFYFNGVYADEIAKNTNYLGDPTLEIWTDMPQLYSDINVTRTDSTVTITGIPSETIIGYCDNEGGIGLMKSSGSTVTLTQVSPNSSFMLFKHNYIPFLTPLVLQNEVLSNSQYVFASEVIAGKSVDDGRSRGDVTVKEGAEYEIEATGKVMLNPGFKVERGGIFSVHKSSYSH